MSRLRVEVNDNVKLCVEAVKPDGTCTHVEVCRGVSRIMSRGVEGVSRACRGAECQGVEGVCLEAKHTAAQQYCLYTIQLLHIQFRTELPHWVCLFIPSTTVFLLLGCSLWC